MYSGEIPWTADTTKSLKPNVLFSTQVRNPSEVLSFAQCNSKLPVTTVLLKPTHGSGEQMEELLIVTEFARGVWRISEVGKGGGLFPKGNVKILAK